MSEEGGGGEGGGEGGGVVRELIAIMGFGVDTKELKKGENSLMAFAEKVKKISTAIAGFFVVKEVGEFMESQIKAMTSIERTSAKLGISTDAVQAYQYAAEAAGLSTDQVTTALSRMQSAQGAAMQGTGKGSSAFQQLGVSIKDTNGKAKDASTMFRDVAEKISKIEDPSKRAIATQAIFGRGGKDLLPILREGGKGIDELMERYRALGGGYTREAIEKAAKLEKATADNTLAFKGLSGQLFLVLAPVMEKVMGWILRGTKWVKDLQEKTNFLTTAMYALAIVAGVLTAELIAASLPIIGMAAAAFVLYLVFDDLVNLFQGNDSLIGRSIDKIFGAGQSADVVKNIKNAWYQVKDAFAQLSPYIDKMWGYLKYLLDNQDRIISVVKWLPPIAMGRAVYAIGGALGKGEEERNRLGQGGYATFTGKGGGQSRSSGQVQSKADYSSLGSYSSSPIASPSSSAMQSSSPVSIVVNQTVDKSHDAAATKRNTEDAVKAAASHVSNLMRRAKRQMSKQAQ